MTLTDYEKYIKNINEALKRIRNKPNKPQTQEKFLKELETW